MLADRFVIERALTEADEHDRPRQLPLGDRLLDQGLNCVEPRRIDSACSGGTDDRPPLLGRAGRERE